MKTVTLNWNPYFYVDDLTRPVICKEFVISHIGYAPSVIKIIYSLRPFKGSRCAEVGCFGLVVTVQRRKYSTMPQLKTLIENKKRFYFKIEPL